MAIPCCFVTFDSLYSVYIRNNWTTKTGVPHCCILPNIVDLRERFRCTQDDRIFNAAPLTFDPSIVEIFVTLSCGACLIIVPDSLKIVPLYLSQVLVKRQQVTVLQITPSLMQHFSEKMISEHILGDKSCIRILAFGGESCLNMSILRRWKTEK